MEGRTRCAAMALFLGCIACGAERPVEIEQPAFVLEGRVVPMGDGAPGILRARTVWNGVETTADVRNDGTFELRLEVAPQGEGILVIEPASGSGTHHPAWIPLRAADGFDDPLVIVLASRSWKVRHGEHQGIDVAISPAAAADPTVLPSYWGFTFGFSQEGLEQTVLDDARWTAALRTWVPARFPVPVALDHTDTAQPFGPADSTLLWGHIGALEAVVGRDLFEPIPRESLGLEDPLASSSVLIRLDAELETRGVAFLGLAIDWFETEDVSPWSENAVTTFATAAADITDATVFLRNSEAMEDRALVVHELMHALGVGHGCSWTSVQTFCAHLSASLPTPEDVAYLEMLEAMRALEKEWETRHGIVAAVLGERVVSLGLEPFPSAELVGQDGSFTTPTAPGIADPLRR